MTVETVAFYSYKGGVGRTLLVANTAQFLAMSGRHVVALDLDLEAPGLHQKLGSREVMRRAAAGTLRGAVDELLDILETEPSERNPAIAFEEVNLPSGTSGSLRLIPAGAAPSHNYWAALERLNSVLRTSSRAGGLPEAILELQARIEEELKPDFLLIDSRTGITELGGLATSLLADRVVCLTTTAPESVDGMKVVKDALRKAPRLKSQKALDFEFLVTRVVNEGSANVSRVKKELEEPEGSIHVLPHDPGVADQERIFFGDSSLRIEVGSSPANVRRSQLLFTATLDWIEKSFRGEKEETESARHKEEVEKTRRRMDQIDQAWEELTATTKHYRRGYGSRAAWPVEQLRKGMRFTSGKKSRYADIVAYDSPCDNSKPQMIVEYVEDEDCDDVAQWWLKEIRVKVVVVLGGKHKGETPIRVVSRTHSSGRWWNSLPLPYDFDALNDPADVSLDALLGAVHRCSREPLFHASLDYLNRIVTEWVRCSAVGLHGGVPWKPHIAKKIIDGLVDVHDIGLARRVLWAASADSEHRENWVSSGDDWLVDQVLGELFAPLLWRLPPEASIEVIREGSRRRGLHGRPSGLLAIGLLARDILGLRYDPDATFRIEGQRILDRSGWSSESHDDRALYPGLSEAFKHTEISFEISSDLPPLAATRTTDEEQNEETQKPSDLRRLVSERIADRLLVTTGFLGDYLPHVGRVVLYSSAITRCAEKLSLQARHVGSVTLIHETLHALMHLGRDLDGRMWPEFALPRADSPLFEPSWFHETLTQYFTYQHILRLRDPALQHAFEAMSARSAAPYRAWERLRNLPIEDARNWLMSVRRGVGAGSIPMQMVLEGMRPET